MGAIQTRTVTKTVQVVPCDGCDHETEVPEGKPTGGIRVIVFDDRRGETTEPKVEATVHSPQCAGRVVRKAFRRKGAQDMPETEGAEGTEKAPEQQDGNAPVDVSLY